VSSERKSEMLPGKYAQSRELGDQVHAITPLGLTVEVGKDWRVVRWLVDLGSETGWWERQRAAYELGQLGGAEALAGLLGVLRVDPFWKVRCAIVQALEVIGDPEAIPALCEVAERDEFQVVRTYAAQAIERLSRK
jgi:hypothetical protein